MSDRIATVCTRFGAALALLSLCSCGGGDADAGDGKPDPPKQAEPAAPATAEGMMRQRQQLDRTLWRDEVEAQAHERVFTGLWDRLREADDPFEVLATTSFESLAIADPGGRKPVGDGIGVTASGDGEQMFDPDGWRQRLAQLRDAGYRIETTEWHHAEFHPSEDGARSKVKFGIDAARETPPHRVAIDGELDVRWAAGAAGEPPQIGGLAVSKWTLTDRKALPVFEEILRAKSGAGQPRLLPLIVRDLDGDGLPEVVAGGLNKRWRNLGGGKFEEETLVPGGLQIFDAGIIADFTGDGRGDLVAVAGDRLPRLWRADEDGRFTLPSRPMAEFALEFPKAFTAGDIDADGDLDLFIGQYKFPYTGGAMPTPFYDSNDGHPALLLRNEGDGTFRDITEQAGLGAKRHRRTYSASLYDHDLDGDLDLLTVNDFAGLDFYLNDGSGQFTDATAEVFDERHLFGMAHTFGDFDHDGAADLYAIGMSSTTVGRLDQLGLAREDRPDITTKRLAMTYGNRLYRRDGTRFVHSPMAASVARTGWAWGTGAADFNLDGALDLYVANGHSSGKTSTDYCTQYWRHDVYTGSSKPDPIVDTVLGRSLAALNAGEISWNGFEKNVLFLGEPASGGFHEAAQTLGVAFEADSRAVVTTDIDADGRPDLLLVTVKILGGGRNEYTLKVLRNTLETNDRNWVGLRLRDGLGATVVLRAGGREMARPIVSGDSFSCQHPEVAHFGLGNLGEPVDATVHWPGGDKTELINLALDRYHAVER